MIQVPHVSSVHQIGDDVFINLRHHPGQELNWVTFVEN